MKELKKTQIIEKISYDLGLEALILRKYSYYLKKSTDLMQFLSKFQWHFPQK